MNHAQSRTLSLRIALLSAATLLGACGVFGGGSHEKEPSVDPGVARTRDALTNLERNPDLAGRAPLALRDAQAAVQAAEQPQSTPGYAVHLAYLAERRVQIARALAETQRYQAQLDALRARREGTGTPQ